jgi:hypothetical protein
MILRALSELDIDGTTSFLIGDKEATSWRPRAPAYPLFTAGS